MRLLCMLRQRWQPASATAASFLKAHHALLYDDDDGRSLRRGVPRLPLKDGEGVGVLRLPVPARRLSFLRL